MDITTAWESTSASGGAPGQGVPRRRIGSYGEVVTGEEWVECRCGKRHWGAYGAAGLLLVDRVPAHQVVLQHRASWTHFGDSWGIPGGARHQGEEATAGALREAEEEAGIAAAHVQLLATRVLAHPDWSYTTALGRVAGPVDPRVTDRESAQIEWVGLEAVPELPLLPAFADAWPELAAMAATTATLIVDAANVVGSRPDGWWRDRPGATARLLAQLETLAERGVPAGLLELPGQQWWPQLVLVTEGQARSVPAIEGGRVQVVAAERDGDTQIVEEAAARIEGPGRPSVSVVTADRELGQRVSALGGQQIRPRPLLELLQP